MSNQNLYLSAANWRQALTIRRSTRARYIRLKLYPTGQLELVVPKKFDERHLPAILDQHEPWVLRTLARLDPPLKTPQATPAPTHIHLPAIDNVWRVDYLADDNGRYGCREQGDGILRVSGGMAWQPALRRWLRRKGKQQLVPWLGRVSKELELPFSGATVRGQKTRWGSCSARRHINLNYALLFLPAECVKYLFVHELCHTVHLNHSPRYWRLVESKEPRYRQLEQELRRATAHVPAWLHARDIHPA